ncbi:MAG: MetS family NSS transporter small subunit [Thermotaleaceae bacterium]
MTPTSIGFFLFGAIVLWGGLALTLTIAIKGEKK